jgi:CubicO group peptidase (beta-lactamase class C family)
MGTGQTALQQALNSVLIDYPNVPGIGGVLVNTVNGTPYIVPAVAGIRRYGSPDTIQPNDTFRWDSCTKPMTGYLLACLFQAHPELFPKAWQTTIADVFPEFANPACRARYGIPSSSVGSYLAAQVQDLMSHSSGLPYAPALGYEMLIGGLADSPAYVSEYCNAASELHRRYLYTVTALQDVPTSIPTYSGGSIICAAMAERKFPGQRWEDLMKKFVFGPLGSGAVPSGRTCVNGPPFGSSNPVDGVWGHSGPGTPDPNSNNLANGFSGHAPAGAVLSNMGDLGLFLLANLGVGLNLPITAANLAASQQTARYRPDGTTCSGWGGFASSTLWHNGASSGTNSWMSITPANKNGYAIAVNLEETDGGAAVNDASNRLSTILANWTSYTW